MNKINLLFFLSARFLLHPNKQEPNERHHFLSEPRLSQSGAFHIGRKGRCQRQRPRRLKDRRLFFVNVCFFLTADQFCLIDGVHSFH